MKIERITYERLVPTYPYANVRVGLEAALADGEDLETAAAALIAAATALCRRELARIDPFYALPEDERAALESRQRGAAPESSYEDLSQRGDQ